MELERRITTIEGLEMREADDSLRFEGHAAVFNKWTAPMWGFREQIAAGAFKKTLSEKPDVRMLINHDGVPIARTVSGTLELSEDSTGLLARASLDRANPSVTELASAMRRGDLDQMSFAFRTIKDEWDETDPKDVKRTIREASLQNGDVSPVTYPAYAETTAEIRSRFAEAAEADPAALLAAIEELRAGKMISAANAAVLQGAVESINGILAAAAPVIDDEPENDDSGSGDAPALVDVSRSLTLMRRRLEMLRPAA